jgi:hypothetical protein
MIIPFYVRSFFDLLNRRLWELAVSIHNLEGTRLLLIIDLILLQMVKVCRISGESQPRPFYLREKSLRYPLGSTFSEVQTRSGYSGENNDPCPCRRSNLYLPARS